MTEAVFLEKMIEVLDTEERLTMDSELRDLEEWDSLSLVSFLAMAKVSTDQTIEPDKVRRSETMRDLFALLHP